MKMRKHKIIGIFLAVAVLLQATTIPVSALTAPGDDVSIETVGTDNAETTAGDLDGGLEEPTTAIAEESLTDSQTDPNPLISDETQAADSGETSKEATESEETDDSEPSLPAFTEPAETTVPLPTPANSSSESEPIDENSEEESSGGLDFDNPIIGPMFSGFNLVLPPVVTPMAANDDSTVVLHKTATYNAATDSVDFRFDIFSTGELATVITKKPTDIILVLDQSDSMNSSFGSYNSYQLWSNNGTNSIRHNSLYSSRDNLYVKVNDQYYKVIVTRTGPNGNRSYSYSYTIPAQPTVNSGTIHQNSSVPDWEFYLQTTQTITRIQALKNATEAFVQAITARAIADGVSHRIAMVGFSNPQNQRYTATEILTVTGSSPIRFDNITNTHRLQSLMDTTTPAGQTGLAAAINRIRTGTYTSTDLGMQMARDILTATAASSTDRDRIVVMLTDGVPTRTNTGASFNNDAANAAIQNSKQIKDAGHRVFTIGILPGANSDPPLPSNAGNETQRANRFLHLVSSNYPAATSMTTTGTGAASNGYYFDDADPDGLIETFQTISEQVGSTNEALTSETVMRDFLIPQLNLPAAAAVSVKTANFTGFDAGDNYLWGPEQDVGGISVGVTPADNSVHVTGFSYKDNYVAMDEATNEARGKKLIVRFSAPVKPDFIGGNVIYPNLDGSGIFLPGQTTVFREFNKPSVDIPLRFDFETNPRSIYLTNSTAPWNLLKTDGHKYLINGTEYSYDGLNNEYANVVYTIKSADGLITYGTYTVPAGAASGSWSGANVAPEEKTAYQITAVVTPVSDGTYSPETVGPKQDFIHVYTPKAEVSDLSLYLSQTTDLAGRMTQSTWVTVDPLAPAPLGTAPSVTLNPLYRSGTNPAGNGGTAAFRPLADSFFDVEVKIDTRDITALSTIVPTAAAAAEGYDFAVFVFYPKAKGSDTTIWLGDTTNLAEQMNGDGWFNSALAPVPAGPPPVLSFTPVFLTGTDPVGNGGAAGFAAKVDSRFNMQVFIGAMDVTSYTQITPSPDGLLNDNHFTVFVISGSLTIQKRAADGTTFDPNQSFIFRVEGPDGKEWTIAIQGEGERTISGLGKGTYTVTEDTSWSWRYEPDKTSDTATIGPEIADAHKTLSFVNAREDNQWLGGEAFAINVYVKPLQKAAAAILALVQRIGG